MRCGRPVEVAVVFLRLGLTAFGGPVAHLAHFRRELVQVRRWCDEAAYAELVAFCQFLPGPTSSQVGFLLGWQRAGLAGAVAAWCSFTLPSAMLLVAVAGLLHRAAPAFLAPWLHGGAVAVLAVVAQAVLAMGRTLCPDRSRALLACGAAVLLLALPGPGTQAGMLVAAALTGVLLRLAADAPHPELAVPAAGLSRACLLLLGVLALAVVAVPLLVPGAWSALAAICATAGGLVFGGGHVVLPLLVPPLVDAGLVTEPVALAGYALAQAMPGPLFTVAAWMGFSALGLPGALVALAAIFLPGLLLALGGLRWYRRLLGWGPARGAVAGLNAGVVGLLGAVLYDPVFRHAVSGSADLALAVAAFAALQGGVPAWLVVLACGGMGVVAA